MNRRAAERRWRSWFLRRGGFRRLERVSLARIFATADVAGSIARRASAGGADRLSIVWIYGWRRARRERRPIVLPALAGSEGPCG